MAASNPVPRLYRTVVDEVVKNVREAFLNEGVDEQVLLELKQLWESKLMQSKAIECIPADASMRMNVTYPHSSSLHGTGEQSTSAQKVSAAGQIVNTNLKPGAMFLVNYEQLTAPAAQAALAIQGTSTSGLRTTASGTQPQHLPINHTQQQQHQLYQQHIQQLQQQQLQQQQKSINNQNVQQAQQGKQVPQQQHLQQPAGIQIIKGPVSTTTYAAFNQAANGRGPRVIYTQPVQQNPSQRVAASKQIIQVDGAHDSSSDDDDDDNFDDLDQYPINVDSNDLDGNEADEIDGGEEGDPLNSGDDISEEDPSDLFDTDNVVVCQYDKIARSKNKWKFYLKDGIMNLKSKDYVFHKANGESEW